jgi:hyperosmotically inducible periplasmic protein
MTMTLRNATLAAALTAVGATAWATTDYVTSHSDLESDAVVAYNEPIAAPVQPTVTEPLTANETVYVPAPAPAPVVEQSVAQPTLTIEDRRLTEDQRLQALVMDKLAAAPNISGKIGVESHQQVVTLTGYTVTAAQGQRAGRIAGSVDGVKSVNNEIRARIGGSV